MVGWRVALSMRVDLMLKAMEQALWSRKVKKRLIHNSDRNGKYLAIRYSECLEEEGVNPYFGSHGDVFDNATAESVIWLFKTEIIRRRGPWKNIDSVDYDVLESVDWFNTRRVLKPIGNILPIEFEKAHNNAMESQAVSDGRI